MFAAKSRRQISADLLHRQQQEQVELAFRGGAEHPGDAHLVSQVLERKQDTENLATGFWQSQSSGITPTSVSLYPGPTSMTRPSA